MQTCRGRVEQSGVVGAELRAKRRRDGGRTVARPQRGRVALAERQLRLQRPRLRDKSGRKYGAAYERLRDDAGHRYRVRDIMVAGGPRDATRRAARSGRHGGGVKSSVSRHSSRQRGALPRSTSAVWRACGAVITSTASTGRPSHHRRRRVDEAGDKHMLA